MALNIYLWIIIARAVLSWVKPDPFNPIVRFIHNVTEPVLYQIRRRLPLTHAGFDFSPIIVIFAIFLAQTMIVPAIMRFGNMLNH